MIELTDRARQILDFAIAKETAAERFYSDWANRCDDRDVHQLLLDLATEERGHIEKLSSITPEALMAEGVAPAEFGLVKELPAISNDRELTVLDALSVAIKREEAAVILYERMRGASSTAESLFAALGEEERRHKHRLELQYALLKSRRDRG
ncbi:ferritin family protein [Candidatus Bipolaricaulota bacterium]